MSLEENIKYSIDNGYKLSVMRAYIEDKHIEYKYLNRKEGIYFFDDIDDDIIYNGEKYNRSYLGERGSNELECKFLQEKLSERIVSHFGEEYKYLSKMILEDGGEMWYLDVINQNGRYLDAGFYVFYDDIFLQFNSHEMGFMAWTNFQVENWFEENGWVPEFLDIKYQKYIRDIKIDRILQSENP